MTTVLVVDDNRDICEIVTVLLTSEGYDVEVGHDGRTALRRCAEAVPDLVLLDVALPDLDGLDVARTLRRTPVTEAVPIVLLTARAHPDDVAAGRAAGADDYLVKPFSATALLDAVAVSLRRRSS